MLLISITFSGALITVLYFSSQMPRTWKFIFDVTTFATKWPLIFLGAILDRVSNVLTFTPNTSEKPRLVIVGASFAGLCALNKLYRDFQVTLIDFKDYFEFVPGILRAYVDPQHVDEVTCPLPTNIPYHFVCTFVESVTYNTVIGRSPRTGDEVVIPYDYLLLACGSNYPGTVKATNAEPSIADRRRTFDSENRRLNSAQTVLIIGGGPVGIELAAEIVSTWPNKIVTIVDKEETLCASFPRKSAEYVTKWLMERNVRLELGVAIGGKYPNLEIDETGCTLANGRRINADVVYICTGFQCNSQLLKQHFSSHFHPEGGAILVNNYLQIDGHSNIYAVGDVMRHESAEPKLAYNAELNALVACQNIIRTVKREPCVKYPEGVTGENGNTPMIYVISLGRYDGTLAFNNMVINGGIAAYAKWFVEWTKIRACAGSFVNRSIWRVGDIVSIFMGKLLKKRVDTARERQSA